MEYERLRAIRIHRPSTRDITGTIYNGQYASKIDEDYKLDGLKGWFIVVGTTAIAILVCSLQSTFGILFSDLLLDMDASSLVILGIFTTHNMFWNLMGLTLNLFVPLLGWRILAMSATTLVSLAFILSAFATTPYFLFFSFSVIGGIGCGLSVAIIHTISPHYFKKYLGVANAFPLGGESLGGIILPLLIRYLLDELAYKGTMLILGALILNATAAAALFRLPERHKRKSKCITNCCTTQEPEDTNINETRVSNESQSSNNSILSYEETNEETSFCRFLRILRSTRVIIIAVGGGLFFISVRNFFALAPFYLQEAGYSLKTSAWLISFSSLMDFLSRMLFSVLSDSKCFSKRVCYMMGILLCTASILGFSFTWDLHLCAILIALFGFGFGATYSVHYLVIVDYVGVEHLGVTYGASNIMMILEFAIFGPLIGYVEDQNDSFMMPFWILAGMSFTTFLLWFAMPAAIINAGKVIPANNY